MEHIQATPFGRSSLPAAHMAALEKTRGCSSDTRAVRREVMDNLIKARQALRLPQGALTVLKAMLSCLPDEVMTVGTDLVIYASNATLQRRADGMDPRSVRRHAASLMDRGLIVRRDSPNGKRYKVQDGDRVEVYGFDLSPLVVEAPRIAAIVEQIEAEARRTDALRRQVQNAKRYLRQAINMAIEMDYPGEWLVLQGEFQACEGRIPRGEAADLLRRRLDVLVALEARVHNLLAACADPVKESANVGQSDRTLLESNTKSSLCFEPAVETAGAAASPSSTSTAPTPLKQQLPLELILRACPDVVDYARDGAIRSWTDLVDVAGFVRSMLGISPSAWEDATATMGPVDAAITVAAILQRSAEIRNPGGYIRALTEAARKGEHSSARMVFALLAGKGAKAAA
jgi:replication initiation protein RepC